MKLSVFLATLLMWLNNPAPIVAQELYLPSSGKPWDFIVCGGGSAGAIMATRLSEVAGATVLLIEAGGGTQEMLSAVPLAAAILQSDTNYNWAYTNEVEPDTCLGMTDNKCAYPRGKGLGGSSSLNAMMHVRGIKENYDAWKADGCTGWDYASVLPYFKKLEQYKSNQYQSGKIVAASHGTTGPMMTEFARYRTVFSTAFVTGAKSLGMTEVDYNSQGVDLSKAVSYLQCNTESGKRETTAYEYLSELAGGRSNLNITVNSLVTKIEIFNGTNATGVLFSKGGAMYRALVGKEVIVCAGVINSPQILMLSGIGPEKVLKDVNITPIKKLPVGAYMTDHMSMLAPTYTTNTVDQNIDMDEVNNLWTVLAWGATGGTVLSLPFGMEALAFGKVSNSSGGPKVPDYEIMFTPSSYATDKGEYQRVNHRLTLDFYNTVFGRLQSMTNDSITADCMILNPKSNGSVTLRDDKATTAPKINAGMFNVTSDKYIMLQCIRKAQAIFKSAAFKPYNPTLYHMDIPNCRTEIPDSDRYWYCAMKHLATSMYHMSGTCRMGPKTGDNTTVVGPDLLVQGMTNLRVADSSVLRRPISGHTAHATMMVAEKGSFMIKKFHWPATVAP